MLERLREYLERLQEQRKGREPGAKPTRLVVFFACHGMLAPSRSTTYLCLHDTDPGSIQITGLDIQELKNYAQFIPAEHQLWIFDACHAGNVLFDAGQVWPCSLFWALHAWHSVG